MSLPLDDEGCDFSIVSDFRQRLIDAHARAPSSSTDFHREPGTWLAASAGGKQLTIGQRCWPQCEPRAAWKVWARACARPRAIWAKEDPEWSLAHLALDWFDRYVHRFPDDALIISKRANNRLCAARLAKMWLGCSMV